MQIEEELEVLAMLKVILKSNQLDKIQLKIILDGI
jgi:hypothetical protein